MAKELTREEKLAKDITEALNAFGFNRKAFCKAMNGEHRYLQAEFGELVMEFIRYAASDDYRYDGRNEWVHDQCQILARHIL